MEFEIKPRQENFSSQKCSHGPKRWQKKKKRVEISSVYFSGDCGCHFRSR
jgi:hypothetical protein